jgi:preprotein translocase subunit YajC
MIGTVGLLAGLGVALFGVAAHGEDAGTSSSSIIQLVVILAVFAAVFYFMLIRPQRERQARHNELIKGLKRGDSVITAGGIHGEIDSIGDTSMVLTIEGGGKIRIAKSSVVNKQAK